MIVTLTPELEAMIREQVERGPYADAGEVVREALRLLVERDRLARLRAAIARGEEDIARGEVVDWPPDFMERLLEEADEEDRLGVPISDDVTP